MTEKFTLEDLFIRIIPGGVLVGVLYFSYSKEINIEFIKGLDFLYTFIFFTFSYLVGEIIQTIARILEPIIYVFFKFYKPSKIFLYKNNPVLNSNYQRDKIMELLHEESLDGFDEEYKNIPYVPRNKELDDRSQGIFMKLYTKVSSDSEIKIFNRGYLLIRAITFMSLFVSIFFITQSNCQLSLVFGVVFLLFLWRARGMARTLVYKTVLINLKNNTNE